MSEHTPLKNHYGYNCPVNWKNFAESYQWATVGPIHYFKNKTDRESSGQLGVKIYKQMPFPTHDITGCIDWEAEGENNESSFEIPYDEKQMKAFILKDAKDEDLEYGKCIWQRPKNSDQ
jgi:hypothetical protein